MRKHALSFTVVSLLLAGCGVSEMSEPEAQGVSTEGQVAQALTCTTTTQGGPTSCKSYDVWKTYTVQYCQSIGATAYSTTVREPCDSAGQAFRYADMKCCN